MDHQSIADLKDCPADLKSDAVVGAVVDNAKFKLVYRVMDPDTADWVARMSGTILVDDEIFPARFEPSKITGWTLEHHLDNQMARIILEQKGAYG